MKKILILLSVLLLFLTPVQGQRIVESQTYSNTVEDWLGVYTSLTTPVSFIFRNNSVTGTNTGGYLTRFGTEDSTAYNGNLDGEQILGNRFTSNIDYPNYSPGPSPTVHGVFVGNMKDWQIRYNYVDEPAMAVVTKSAVNQRSTVAGSGIAYNIIKAGLKCITVKGMSGVQIYNNTLYQNKTASQTWRGLIQIYKNRDVNGSVQVNSNAQYTKIYNNIFYVEDGAVPMIFFEDDNPTYRDECLVGFECDYNVYYSADADYVRFRVGNVGATQWYNFAQWQALGYDQHSVVINPNFIDKVNFVPANRLDYGIPLAVDFQNGLSENAVWTVGLAPATTPQVTTLGKWQVGARIETTETPVFDAYYVATNGNDNNAGTMVSPWATWQKAFATVTVGQTVYIRGGTYYPAGTSYSGSYSGAYASGKSGSSTSKITIQNYPGEVPIMDCDNMNQVSSHFGIRLGSCNWWVIKGLKIKNAKKTSLNYGATGIDLRTSNNNTVENCEVSYCGGPGITVLYESENNLLKNCDSHHNYDVQTEGENADGFIIGEQSYRTSPRINTMIGCRAWDNSDDGFDHYRANGLLIFENCWAWRNGIVPGSAMVKAVAGDGNGFKLGRANILTDGVVQAETRTMRRMTNCMAISNYTRGFSQEDCNFNMRIFNCTSYGNKQPGFNFVTYNRQDTIINCISNYNGGDRFLSLQLIQNTFINSDTRITNIDFQSVDVTQLDDPRQADGSLPVITAFHLVETSEAIDYGKLVGLPYYGAKPDAGIFEYYGNAPPPAPISILTTDVFSIDQTSASVSGNATDGGGGTIVQKGVTWSSVSNLPNIVNHQRTLEGSGLGAFTSTLTALYPNTTYWVRAYATNSLAVTGYGEVLSFKTDASGLIIEGLIIVGSEFIKDGTTFIRDK